MTFDNASSESKQLSLVIADYLQAVEAGHAPDRDKLLADHPDIAEELREFLSTHDQLQKEAGLPVPLNKTVTLPPRGLSEDYTLDSSTSGGEAKVGTMIRYFGDYELLEEIARGGMGVVYKAKQVNLNRAGHPCSSTCMAKLPAC
jgi:serine/threonine-protein kinase